jgi:hypothetical protein
MNSYPISEKNKFKESNIINVILFTNKYALPHITRNITLQLTASLETEAEKMGHIYMFRQKSRKIANLFKNTDIQVCAKTTNTICNH